MIERGYQYLPDGWTRFNVVNTSENKPSTVTDNLITVDDAWWGNFTHRGFNISTTTSSVLTGKEQATLEKLHILVPVN